MEPPKPIRFIEVEYQSGLTCLNHVIKHRIRLVHAQAMAQTAHGEAY